MATRTVTNNGPTDASDVDTFGLGVGNGLANNDLLSIPAGKTCHLVGTLTGIEIQNAGTLVFADNASFDFTLTGSGSSAWSGAGAQVMRHYDGLGVYSSASLGFIPSATRHVIRPGGKNITQSGTFSWKGEEPSLLVTTLTNNESAAATVLEVDDDITTVWGAKKATGGITYNANPEDAHTITVGGTTFEFDDDSSVGGGNVAVTIGEDLAATMANLEAAVDGEGGCTVSATAGADYCSFLADTAGRAGNVEITTTPGGEEYIDSLSGMSGGHDMFNPGVDTVQVLIVGLDETDATYPDVELRTVSSWDATSITITAGLTRAKDAGGYVVLLTRNCRIPVTASSAVFSASGVFDLAVEIQSNQASNLAQNTAGCSLSGGVYYGTSVSRISNMSCLSVTDSVLAIAGSSSNPGALNSCAGATILDSYVLGCYAGMDNCSGLMVSGTMIQGCYYGIANSAVRLLDSGTALSDNKGADMFRCSLSRSFEATVNSPTQALMTTMPTWAQVQCFNLGGVAGSDKVFMRGGTVATATFALGPYATAHKFSFTEARKECFRDWEIWAGGGKVTFDVWIDPDVTDPTEYDPIAVLLLDPAKVTAWDDDYLARADYSGSGVKKLSVSYTPAYPRPLLLRVIATPTGAGGVAGNLYVNQRQRSAVGSVLAL